MKKIILLLLIILIIPIVIIDEDSKNRSYYNDNFPDLPKDEKWEYVKERVFNGYNEKVFKFTGPILCELYNATAKDSLVVNEILEELKILLTNKEVDYFKNYTGISLKESNNGVSYKKNINSQDGYKLNRNTIKLFFHQNDTISLSESFIGFSTKEGVETYKHDKKYKTGNLGIEYPHSSFVFNENTTLDERKKVVKRDVIRIIACVNFFQPKALEKIVDLKKSLLNDKELVSINYHFSQLDKFLLQKLYSPNLKKEFRAYMYKTYPWRYASKFLNTVRNKVIALWVSVVLGITFFLTSFSLIYKRKYKRLYFSYFTPILFILLGGLYIYKIYNYITIPYGFEHWRQYISVHVIFIILASLIALCLMLFDKYFIKMSMSFTTEIILKVSFTFLICMFPIVIVFLLENNPNVNWFKLNTFILMVISFAVSRGVLLYLDYFSESLVKQKDVELSHLKEINAQAEVKLLQSQINPHFLYNALNSIATLARKNAGKTEQMALSLSDLFKYSINKKGDKMSTVADEVEMVQNYLDIEQIRFGDRLKFSIQVDKDVKSVKIPMFIIQPLIENAVKHGISKIEGAGEIMLNIKKKSEGVEIIVEDNGPHFSEGVVSGHGLQTVFDLLRLTYGEKASLSWENEPVKHIKILIEKTGLK